MPATVVVVDNVVLTWELSLFEVGAPEDVAGVSLVVKDASLPALWPHPANTNTKDAVTKIFFTP
jgi:hypothetical protein